MANQDPHPLVVFAASAECSQQAIAREAGLSEGFLSRVIRRQRELSVDAATRLQDACAKIAARLARGRRKRRGTGEVVVPTWQQILERDESGRKAVGE